MADTPAQQIKAITGKLIESVTPDTKVAIPLILVAGVFWFVLDTVRNRDLERLTSAITTVSVKSDESVGVARENRARIDDLMIRITRMESDRTYDRQAVGEMKDDIRGILLEIRQMRKDQGP